MKSILERVAEGEILISDGAMGTFLQAKGLQPGECPESWCVSHPEAVKSIAEAYFAARGFRNVARSTIKGALGHSAEFTGACPESALCMELVL